MLDNFREPGKLGSTFKDKMNNNPWPYRTWIFLVIAAYLIMWRIGLLESQLGRIEKAVETHSSQCWDNHKITHKTLNAVIEKAESQYGVSLGDHK